MLSELHFYLPLHNDNLNEQNTRIARVQFFLFGFFSLMLSKMENPLRWKTPEITPNNYCFRMYKYKI